MWRFILQVFLVHFVFRLITFIWAVAILEIVLYLLRFLHEKIWEQICYTFLFKKLEDTKIQLEKKALRSVIHHRHHFFF
jgi:hypothetical protein